MSKSTIPKLVNNYKGPNIAGGEYSPGPGKTYGHDYIYANTSQIDYYAFKGFGIIRLPFDIARIYSVPYSPLNITELEYMNPTIDYCLSKGMRVILDPHNYGYIYDNRTGSEREIGTDPEATNMFADFWGRMASVYKNYSNVVFGLMNEPHNQTAAAWYSGAVPAIKAIRAVGATQLILIPGTSWTGAWRWNSSGNAVVWAGFAGDPMNNFAFDMHQYLDDGSGHYNSCMTNSSHRLEFATEWLITNKFKGFLSEFAWGNDPSCINEGPPMLDYVSANADVWMGWSWWCSGLWVRSDYIYMLDPISFEPPYIDRPQMAVLLSHI